MTELAFTQLYDGIVIAWNISKPFLAIGGAYYALHRGLGRLNGNLKIVTERLETVSVQLSREETSRKTEQTELRRTLADCQKSRNEVHRDMFGKMNKNAEDISRLKGRLEGSG